MTDWRPAYSLQTLKSQLDAIYPGWLFLGFLGDQAHASVPSDHNRNAQGVVTALDIGPGGGLDIHELANRLAANPHPDPKYIISNRRMAEWQNGFKWRAYGGSDPHDTHIHVSVGRGPDGQSKPPYDDTIPWNVTKGEPMITESTAEFNRFRDLFQRTRGRDPSLQEFKNNAVGKTWLTVIEILSSGQEAKDVQQWQEVGKTAIQDKWDQQIYGLQDQVKARDKLIAEIQKKADLSDSLQKKIDDLNAERQKDTETGNSVVRWLGNLFNKKG